MSELETRAVGIGAQKGSKINLKLNVSQVVNTKAFVSIVMRIACSNQVLSFVGRTWQSAAEGPSRGVLGPSLAEFRSVSSNVFIASQLLIY